MTYRKTVGRGAVSTAALIFAASIGNAQAQPAADATSKDERPIEKVVVTAQKRPQQLQDVPISVTTVSGELFRDTGSKDIKDLQIVVPGMTVTSTSSEAVTTARLRGVGTVGDNPGLESSVGIVIDGVYRPRNSVGFGDLGEVSRIEVLKGPQSAVFGKNTSAGVINILTSGPDKDFGASGEFTASNFDGWGGSVSVTGPIGDTLSARIFAVKRERDGYYDLVTGAGTRQDHDADQNYYSVRGQLLWEPSDDVALRIIADLSNRDENCCAAVALDRRNTASGLSLRGNFVASAINLVRPNSVPTTLDPFSRLAYANASTAQIIDDGGLSGQLDWDLSDSVGFTAVTGWRTWEADRGSDVDYSAADILRAPHDGDNNARFEQFSQEARFAGDWSWGSWLVGAFYAHEKLNTRVHITTAGLSTAAGPAGLTQQEEYYARRFLGTTSFNAFNAAIFPTAVYTAFEGQHDLHEQETNSFALFTNESFDWEGFELTLGLRYTHDEKELSTRYDNDNASLACSLLRANSAAVSGQIAALPANPGESNPVRIGTLAATVCSTGADPIFDNRANFQTNSENELTGTTKLMYRFNEDFMVYGSWARGYKAGGFNLDRERTGSALAPVYDPNTAFPEEIVKAWEGGTKTSWFNGTALLNLAYFHQQYTNFQLNTFTGTQFIVTPIPELTSKGVDMDFVLFAPIKGLTVQGGVAYAQTQYGKFNAAAASVPAILPGSRISFGPMWSATLAATQEFQMGDGNTLRFNLAGKFNSKYNTGSDLNPFKAQGETFLVNGRIGFGPESESWALELWAQNLLDEEIIQVAFDAPAQSDTVNAFLAAPRTFGVTVRGQF